MAPLQLTDRVTEQLDQLDNRYRADNQSLPNFLDGLLQARYLTYWDYVNLDAMLSLQIPRTSVADEMIFITYHQITELYFKLILWEIEQIAGSETVTELIFLDKIDRINRYYENLIYSFDVMTNGMDKGEFVKFRTALTPASGFQSVQYRLIEICSTELTNLVRPAQRWAVSASNEDAYEQLYWKWGATNVTTGQKDVSLVDFERKYDGFLRRKAAEFAGLNLWSTYKQRFTQSPSTENIQQAMRRMDSLANVKWPLSHFKTATKFLQQGRDVLAATGGTNWRQYLPPSYQQVIFFPDLLTSEEVENWGRTQFFDLVRQAA